MHFLEQDVKWAGIDFDKAELFMVGENFSKTNMAKSVQYNIVRYKGNAFDIIAVGNKGNGDKFDLSPISNIEKVLSAAISKSVGEFPVIVGVNKTGTVSFNFVIRNTQWLWNSIEVFGETVQEVFGVTGIAAVTDVEPYEVFKKKLESGKRSPNSLYVPTHDGVPALWLTDGSTRSKVTVNQNPISDGLSTSDMKHFFTLSKQYEEQDKLRESAIKLPNEKEVVFMYNSHYQHFNGSLPYNILMYPMFVRMWEECCTQGDFEQAYNNWEMWHKTGGISEAVFIKKEEKKVEPVTAASSESESLGKWNHTEHCEDVQGTKPDKACVVDSDKLSAKLIQMCVVSGTQTPEIKVYSEDKNFVDSFMFEPDGDTRVVGHGFEIAELLIEAIKEAGVNVDKAYVIK